MSPARWLGSIQSGHKCGHANQNTAFYAYGSHLGSSVAVRSWVLSSSRTMERVPLVRRDARLMASRLSGRLAENTTAVGATTMFATTGTAATLISSRIRGGPL